MKVEVLDAELVASGGDGFWHAALRYTDDTGTVTMQGWAFPADTLEWRAAEYGIDHTDTHTLMDLVLAEALLTADDWAKGTFLYGAPDIPTARADHVARCHAALERNGITPSKQRRAASPLDKIRAESPIDPAVIEVKAQLVDDIRQSQTAAAAAAAELAAMSRADLYRAYLFGPPPGPRTDVPNPAVPEIPEPGAPLIIETDPDTAAQLIAAGLAVPAPAEPDEVPAYPWPAGSA